MPENSALSLDYKSNFTKTGAGVGQKSYNKRVLQSDQHPFTPLIDKIVFTIPTTAKDGHAFIDSWLAYPPVPNSDADTQYQGQFLKFKNGYQNGMVYRLSSKDEGITVQSKPYQDKHDYIRITINPSNTEQRECWINYLYPNLTQTAKVVFNPELLNITEVHYAIDVKGLYPHEYLITGKGNSSITRVCINRTSKLVETVYIGSNESDNQYRTYDKSAQTLKNGKIIPQTVRFEQIHKPKKQAKPLNYLEHYQPFKMITVNLFPEAKNLPPEIDSGEFMAVLESCATVGADLTIKRYSSPKKRKLIKQLLTSCPAEWFNDITPKTFHPALVDALGLIVAGANLEDCEPEN